MTLTAKTVSTTRNTVGKAQTFRGSGDASASSYSPGANKRVQYAVGEYNFSEDGALLADAIFGTGVFVPPNAVVTRSGLFNHTVMTSSGTPEVGATLYGAQVAADDSADFNLVVSAAIATVLGGSVVGTCVPQTAATWLHTGAAPREILIDMTGAGGAALTAGRVFVWCEYFIIENTLS